MADEPTQPAVEPDLLLNGRLRLHQPRHGHRAGTDAVLLAACVPEDFAGFAYDIGAGVGTVGLAAALRATRARVALVERAPDYAQFARLNCDANGLAERVSVICCDLFDQAARAAALAEPANLLLTNPPFFAAGTTRPSPDAGRRAAHVLDPGVTLADWLRACLTLLDPHGQLIAILPASTLAELLRALPPGLGSITAKAVHPRDDAPASRLLLRIRKGSRAPFSLAAPLVLHGASGFLPLAARVHAGEELPDW